MSGKYVKNKKPGGSWKIPVILVLLLILAALLWIACTGGREEAPLSTESAETAGSEAAAILPSEPSESVTEPAYTFEQEAEDVTSFSLEQGLEIVRYGKYIGAYMEDGSDEIVANVMMIEVRNTGENHIQYAKITVTGPAGDAVFALTTLMPGQSMIVLEAERKPYSNQDVYNQARADNVAYFAEMPGLQEDKIQIQPLDGGFHISNISGEDIAGQICVYFKDIAGDMLYGGITYVARIDGLAAGEEKQILSSNFNDANSRVVFIQIIG